MNYKNCICLLFLFFVFCKSSSKKKNLQNNTPASVEIFQKKGIVTYKNKEIGCNHLIITKEKDTTLFLIPIPPLIAEEYPEGCQIQFKYSLSKRIQPQNCFKGQPILIKEMELLEAKIRSIR